MTTYDQWKTRPPEEQEESRPDPLMFALRAAAAEEKRLRAEVVAWMAAEGAAGRLRTNADAPQWREYLAAGYRLTALLAELAP